MIFKRWFKPKWQHENAAVRQLAIADLDRQTPQQKEILHELAFNDGAETVRRAALERLNEFSLWWQASKHESAERLKAFAEQQLINMLLENRVSAQLKLQFIAECNRTSVLEKLASSESDPSIKFDLLQRLGRQDLILQALHESVLTIEQKELLLAGVQEEKILEKLLKSADITLHNQISQQLATLKEAREKPERIRKQVVLLLAKLNSIRERNDVVGAIAAFELGKQQWQEFASELKLLADSEEFHNKFIKICQLTDAALAPKIAEAQAERERVLKAERSLQQFEVLVAKLNTLSEALGKALEDGELTIATALQADLDEINRQSLSAELNISQLRQVTQLIAQLQQRLDKLPELADALTQAAKLIAEISAQALPTIEQVSIAYQAFKNWQKSFNLLARTIGLLMPTQFATSYDALVQQWQQHCEPLLAEQQKSIRQLKSKFAEFKRLYEAGKYNVLFGLYKGIDQQFTALSPDLQQQLLADKEYAAEIIEKLSGLQAYIATPRKQQLVQEMQSLIADDTYALPERAAKIKQLRGIWNSLGKADADLEEALNSDFNLACEQAFLPCREFFAKQDAERALSAKLKSEVISKLNVFVRENLKAKQLEQTIQQMQKEWEQSGIAEKSVYAELQPQYHALIGQLKQQQIDEYKANTAAKRLLIESAAQLVLQAETENLVSAVKDLQTQWTAVGFAGRKLDQQLWAEFRSNCDAVFARRNEIRQQQTQQIQQRKIELQAQFEQLSNQVTVDSSSAQIAQTLVSITEFGAQVDVRNDKQLSQSIRELKNSLQDKSAQLQVHHERSVFEQLFAALQDPMVDAAKLPAVYRLVFNQQQEQTLSRADLTLALEWSASVQSPAEEQSRRQQVQMQLLTDKHNSGGSCSQNELLGRWLQYGPITEAEQGLLQRVKRLYLKD